MGIVDDVVHIDVLELVLEILGALEVILVAYDALIARLHRSTAALFGAKAAKVLAHSALDLRKTALATDDLLAAPVRRAERVRRRLVPARAIVDLDSAVLNIVVLVQLIKVPAVHCRIICHLARVVNRVASYVFGAKVRWAEELLMLWRK